MRKFDFTPDPRVLLALTHTPMQPLDALCELIDNSIDSFSAAKLKGIHIESPRITVELPARSQIANGSGLLRVSDNGPGMSDDEAEHAIKAGFSGNNPYDSLGLFGMGFNISTGKLGNRTVVMTTQKEDPRYIKTTIDLNAINQTKDYQLDVEEVPKSDASLFREGESGTVVEVDDWWPDGNANHGFIEKLIKYGKPKIRAELGRRYATILRDGKIQLFVDDEACEPFEHCVWGSNRYVVRHGNQIPARFDFDQVLYTTRRCTKCTAIVPDGADKCPECGETTFRTIPERVYGWVGIQRYDDQIEFGIDLIRNGRAIRKGEKAAFFEYVDELQNTIKDYPIDSQFGRIVGEVHLDFVPVDFMKTDFQRSSEEWQHAMQYLRGTTSLQPSKTNGVENDSPIYQLYQGYRRVRHVGKGDMYMGVWDPSKRSPVRVSRELEQEYLARFRAKEPGYYDDSEWWKLVETADRPPAPKFKECPECGFQNPESAEECGACGYIFEGKPCLNPDCGKTIPKSALVCPHCGTSQIVYVSESWDCKVCGTRNPPETDTCQTCGSKKDTPNPVSQEKLATESMKDDELSSPAVTVALADGSKSKSVEVTTYSVPHAMENWATHESSPIVVFRGIDSLTIFVDKAHPLFVSYGIPVEDAVAAEIAQYVRDGSPNLGTNAYGSVTTLQWEVMHELWEGRMRVDKDSIATDANSLLEEIAKRLQLAHGSDLSSYYGQLSRDENQYLTSKLYGANLVTQTNDLLATGGYVCYAPPSFIGTLFSADPGLFFDGTIWSGPAEEADATVLDVDTMNKIETARRRQFANCLESAIQAASGMAQSDFRYLQMTRYAIDFLSSELVEDV
ncbi:MAG: ATP-binding protein [Coriobacteriales bacterium]|jgi:ribosomal protein L40E